MTTKTLGRRCPARSAWGSLERRGGSWEARWSDPLTKKPRRKVVGKVAQLGETLSDLTKERLLAEVKARVTGGYSSGATFAAFLESYESIYRVKVRKSTADTTYGKMRAVAAALRSTPMAAVDVPTCERVLAAVCKSGNPNTMRTMLARLRHFWDAAKKRGVVGTNPWKAIERPRARPRIAVVMTAAQLEEMYAACPADLRPAVQLMAETGLRVDEAARLLWTDVHEDHVAVRESKSEPRFVPLSDMACAALALAKMTRRRQRQKSATVFPLLEIKRRSYQRKRFQDALARAGLPRMRFHDLRHSLGYRMGAAGNSPVHVGRVLGISAKTATMYMSHNPHDQARHAIGLLQSYERAKKAEARPSVGSSPDDEGTDEQVRG